MMRAPSPPPPPPAPELPSPTDEARGAAMAEEAIKEQRKKRRGRGSTIVAGLTEEGAAQGTAGRPTILG